MMIAIKNVVPALIGVAFLAFLVTGCASNNVAQEPVKAPPLQAVDISAPFSEEYIYTVKEGDTLMSIARQIYDDEARWPLLYYANKDIIDSPEDIAPGMKIYVLSKDTRLTYDYVVQEKDTLSKIALKFYSDKSKVDIIAEYNHLKDPDVLSVGEKLTIPLLR